MRAAHALCLLPIVVSKRNDIEASYVARNTSSKSERRAPTLRLNASKLDSRLLKVCVFAADEKIHPNNIWILQSHPLWCIHITSSYTRLLHSRARVTTYFEDQTALSWADTYVCDKNFWRGQKVHMHQLYEQGGTRRNTSEASGELILKHIAHICNRFKIELWESPLKQ